MHNLKMELNLIGGLKIMILQIKNNFIKIQKLNRKIIVFKYNVILIYKINNSKKTKINIS